MKKNTSVLILSALLLIGFTGCKGKKNDAPVAAQDFTIRTQQVTAQEVENEVINNVIEETVTVEEPIVKEEPVLTNFPQFEEKQEIFNIFNNIYVRRNLIFCIFVYSVIWHNYFVL